MPAYFTDKTQDAFGAREHDAFARLQTAGPWAYRAHTHQGRSGVIAVQKDIGEEPSFSEDAFLPPKTCRDGLVYFPHKQPIAQAQLAKGNALRGFDVTVVRGLTLTIPLVDLAPKFVDFGGLTPAEPATELERRMVILWARFREWAAEQADAKANGREPDLTKRVMLADPDVLRVVALGIQANYRVTDETLSDQRWITSADLQPILDALEGASPKSDADGKATSPLSPVA